MNSQEFTHRTLGQTVCFGQGKASQHAAREARDRDARRLMLIASERESAHAATVAADLDVHIFWNEVIQHVPVNLAHRATAAARDGGVDLIVSVGGGSTTGLAKAIALETGIPIIAVPTTFAGSEATNVWGLTEEKAKTTGSDDRVLPAVVIYDADLVATLPPELAIASGLNALAHCVDSLWAPNADPINQVNALEAARALAQSLREMQRQPGAVDNVGTALYGCYLSAVSFASAGSGLHHKICHVLGGTFDLPHAETHAVVLPHVLALNATGIPGMEDRLNRALSADEPHPGGAVGALVDLYREIDAPTSLQDLGLTTDDIPDAVTRILAAAPTSNPVDVTDDKITLLLRNAVKGDLHTLIERN